jgi:hypothetical protein
MGPIVSGAQVQKFNSPTALFAGATKAEAAATRRARRKKERILAIIFSEGGEVC